MSQMKRYLEQVIHETTDDLVEADAVEYALYMGWIKLTYDLQRDKIAIQKDLLSLVEKFRWVAEENQQVNAPMQELLAQVSDWK